MLVTAEGGDLVELPLLPPPTNRLLRVAKMELSPTGRLDGTVQEIRWGAPATRRRAQFLEAPAAERSKVLERFLSGFLAGSSLLSFEVENLEDFDKDPGAELPLCGHQLRPSGRRPAAGPAPCLGSKAL